ncbi:hypothetical protein BH11PLA2_BH11PLA2_50560 [soil metagenome]
MNAAVTGCTADFTTGTVALLKGLARHHPDVARYCFAIPEQVTAVQTALGSLAIVQPIPRLLNNAPKDAKIRVSWSRVFIPTIPADTVAWFDSDVIVCGDAAAWWQVPPGKVNVVPDAAYRIRHMIPHGLENWYFQRFKLDPDAPGFNAGVFALRPADWPDLAERFESLLAEHDSTRQPFAFDQGLLNGLFQAHANWLPREYNAHCLAECGVPRDVRVIHYTGSPKPWAPGFDHATDAYEQWLLHGESVTDPATLAKVKWQRRLSQPRRLLHRGMRKLLHVLGRRPDMGVGRKPESP